MNQKNRAGKWARPVWKTTLTEAHRLHYGMLQQHAAYLPAYPPNQIDLCKTRRMVTTRRTCLRRAGEKQDEGSMAQLPGDSARLRRIETTGRKGAWRWHVSQWRGPGKTTGEIKETKTCAQTRLALKRHVWVEPARWALPGVGSMSRQSALHITGVPRHLNLPLASA